MVREIDWEEVARRGDAIIPDPARPYGWRFPYGEAFDASSFVRVVAHQKGVELPRLVHPDALGLYQTWWTHQHPKAVVQVVGSSPWRWEW